MKHLMEAQEEDEKKIERDREFFFFFLNQERIWNSVEHP